MDDDPARLRALAVRLYAMAGKLVVEAVELQDRATAIEEAALGRAPEAPQPTQLQQQIQPKTDEE